MGLVFSSSASIYAPGADLTVDEQSALAPGSPYATSKMVVELFLADVARATGLRVLSLRYFNPIGADPQLRTGLQLAAPSHAVGKLLEAYATGTPFHVTGVGFGAAQGSATVTLDGTTVAATPMTSIILVTAVSVLLVN